MRRVNIGGVPYFVSPGSSRQMLCGRIREVLIPARVKRRGSTRWTERFVKARRARDVYDWTPSWMVAGEE